MQQEKLTLESIRRLDFGVIGAAFEKEVARVAGDCKDRPLLEKARVVGVVFSFVPVVDSGGRDVGEQIEVQAQIYSTIPKQVTDPYVMQTKSVAGQTVLMFRPDEPNDPNADHLYDEDVRRRERQSRRDDAAGDVTPGGPDSE